MQQASNESTADGGPKRTTRRTRPPKAPHANDASAAPAPKSRRTSPPLAGEVAAPAPHAPHRRTTPPVDPLSLPTMAPPSGSSHPTPRPRRASITGGRAHESTIQGLAERARVLSEQHGFYLLPDPLLVALPRLRQALLNRALDEALRFVAEEVVGALGPAASQIWLAEPAPWTSETGRIGGQELFPSLRLHAVARTQPASGDQHDANPLLSQTRWPVHTDPLIEAVTSARDAVILHDPAENPLADGWRSLLPSTAEGEAAPALGTLVAYPLRARGQFLGVLTVGTAQRLTQRQVTALEEVADLAAIAADRDRLLSYSRSHEALSQTVLRHAPVAMAVLTGPDHIFALTNPTFLLLLGLETVADVTGQRLADAVPDRARSLASSLRLDAVYEGGDPQAMIELPIHLDRGMTYWNVTTSPLPGISTTVGGVLIAAVEVTRQVVTRQRAQESAEVAQERIGQMMTLHATSLAVASQLGADPSELLADILGRSIALLGARAGTVYVRDPRHDELEVIVCQGLRGEYTGERIRVGEGLAGQVALTGQGLIVDDYRAYPFRAAIYADEAFSAVIAVPLIHRGQVVGVLDVLDDAEQRAFSDDDLWLLELFAAQGAQAIENARTYVELEHAYRKQRDLDRMKDDFIATASHELRTPLTGVQGFLDLLLEYPQSRDDALALDFLHKAAASAQELAEIAERLLQTSRLDTGRLELHATPVRLAALVEEVLRSFSELQHVQETKHELLAEVPPETFVLADQGRLKEVLDNLVGNALKYSPHGGVIRVECVADPERLDAFWCDPTPLASLTARSATTGELQALTATPLAIEESPTMELPHLSRSLAPLNASENEHVTGPLPAVIEAAASRTFLLLLVHDQGMGIAPDERHRLFGRFSRLDSARESQIRGTGLGLYICRQITRAMGGDVWLYASAPGQGSTFAVALPAAKARELATAHDAQGAAMVF